MNFPPGHLVDPEGQRVLGSKVTGGYLSVLLVDGSLVLPGLVEDPLGGRRNINFLGN